MVVLRSISAASCVVDPNIWLQEGGGGAGTSSVSMQEGSVFKSSSEEMLQAPPRPNQHHPASAAAPQHQHQQQQQHHHLLDRRLKPNVEVAPKCPRCDSSNTKFCYYNNYSLSQPRYFCKTCRRYWTKGGSLRNVPVGGGCRKNKRTKRATESHQQQQQQQQQQQSQNPNSSEPTSSNSTSTSNNNSSVSNSSKKTSGDLNLCSPAPPSLDQLNLSSVYFSLLRQDGTDSLPAFTAFGAAAGADPSCSLMAGMAGLEALPPSELAPLPNLPNLAALQALKGATGLLSELDSTAATLTQRSSCSGGSTSRSCMSKSETATTALAAAAADLSPIYDTHVSTSAPMSQVGDAFNEAAHQQIAAAAAAAAESSCGTLPWHQNHPENHSSHRLSIPLLMEDHDPNHHQQQQPPLIMPSAFMHRDKHHNNSGSSASDLNFRHMLMNSVQASAGNWQLPSLSENLLDTAAVAPLATNNTLGTSFNWNVSVPTWPDFSAFAPSSFSNPLI